MTFAVGNAEPNGYLKKCMYCVLAVVIYSQYLCLIIISLHFLILIPCILSRETV